MPDRELAGRLVQRLVETSTTVPTWSALSVAAKVSRSSLYRMRDGDPKVTAQVYRRVETALGLPYESLASVAAHDFDVCRDMGMEEGIVRWLEKQAQCQESSSATGAPTT
jgi:hypothetical protein